jgi:ABC-2 type transport system ATP-binding protein
MTGSADPKVEVDSLTKSFAGVTAVDRISFSVGEGEIFGLVGPDGAGKTTTMRMLAGVMRSTSGAVRVDGVDVIALPELAKHHVSYMPQRFGL